MNNEQRTNTLPSVVILGASLAGLSYGYNKIKKGFRVIMVEKDKEIGGLMKTFNFNGFLFDFGPHVFRSKDVRILEFFKRILHNNYHTVTSNPAIFKYGKFFDSVIPVITYRNISQLPEHLREKALKEVKNLNNNKRNVDPSNFESFIISQVGETLYWEFFGEYSKKWWSVDPKLLSADLAPRNLRIGREKKYGHITTGFTAAKEELYPLRGGIFQIAKNLATEIVRSGGSIKTGYQVKGLEADGDAISNVIVQHKNDEIEVSTEKSLAVSTIPLSVLSSMLNIDFDLSYRADICIFIKLKGKRLFDYSWIYFHDSDVLFSRIHEPIYYSPFNAPSGYSSICAEVTCFEGDKLWNDKYIGDKVLEQLMDLDIIHKSHNPEVLATVKNAYAYPVYTTDYKQKLKKIFEQLKVYSNLKIIGRTGAFSYDNMGELLKWAIS